MPSNPFIFGGPIHGEAFLNRKRELRRLATRLQQGGSAVITAEPCMGKTSLLQRLQKNSRDLFGQDAARIVFCYLDGHTMAGWDTQRFWREAFRPLQTRSPEAARACSQEDFNTVTWESIFATLEEQQTQFVLLLDEFDALQKEPALHQPALYGMLRSLVSRYRSFSLVISTRATTTDLNYRTKEFASGSPYFNFAQEIALEPFPQKDVDVLLARAGERFTPADRAFIHRVAGRHPYFLQAAAYYLWEWYEESADAQTRYEETGRELFADTGESVLSDIWSSWTPYMQMAFTLTALDTVPLLLENQVFDIQALLRDLPYLSPELRKLERRGFLRPDERLQSGYTPHAEVMLWYLADELKRLTRSEMELEEWLTKQQWDGFLKAGEKQAFGHFLENVGALIREGASAFIKAAAEGAARGVTGQ
jgi:hypothetical protein